EWYPRNMYVRGSRAYKHHQTTYGPQSQFGYKNFIPRFRAEHFDARRWMALFRAAGARYVVPVAEHCDGFAMYDSDVTEWCAAKKGPKRDVLHELDQAARREGLVFGASSHRAEHWWFFDRGMQFDSDVRDPANAALYGPAVNQQLAENQLDPPDKEFLDDWLLRSCEIVDKYRPQLMYFDWWICQPVFQPYLKRFAAYYYNRGVEWKEPVAITFKRWEGESFPAGAGILEIERGVADGIRTRRWQCDTSVSKNSWGYVANDDYKDVGELVDDLVDIVSKNGSLLLNIGPKADGTIPAHEATMLREIGRWLATNGEAIYDTRPWRVYGEGPTRVTAGSFAERKRAAFTASDIRFTTKGQILYAIALGWPENGKLLIKSLSCRTRLASGDLRSVQLLGYDGELRWQRTDQGLVVSLPDKPPCDFAVALKITGLAL
ncbi:MAG TPA: alpha-L-fucosidase, partial [Lacipirellulaceae bacterium]|nr:alpha-L-fucosidase [Lacipirellulaceae bacterium]